VNLVEKREEAVMLENLYDHVRSAGMAAMRPKCSFPGGAEDNT